MASYIPQRGRRLATWAFVSLCAVGLFAYGHVRPETTPPADTMVFAMSVEDGSAVLASAVVPGEAGQKVQVRMVCEADPAIERMRLTLDPVGVEDGQVLYSYELSVKGHVETQRGTVKLAMGRERRIKIRSNGPGGVTLSLYAAPLRHPGVERYLQQRKVRLAPAAS